MRSKARWLAAAAGVVLFAALSTGCTTPALSQDMKAGSVALEKRHPHSVHLFVDGGRESVVGQLPQISDEAFTAALTESVNETRLFASIDERGSADYLLEAIIFNISQWIYRSGVRLEIAWRLTDQAKDQVVWRKSIETTGQGYGQGAALEAAAKRNIEQAFEEIARLDL